MAHSFELAEAYTEFTVRDSRFHKTLGRVRQSLTIAQARMDAVAVHARRMLMAGTAAFAGIVKVSADFEQSMARVKALTGAAGEDFESLRDKAKELGRTTVYSARQSAQAMGFFGLAGFKTDQILKSMASTLDLAAAGQMDVAQAADIAAKIMKGMGLEAKDLGQAVDVLAKAFTTSNTDLVQLGEAMKYVGPVGRSAGKKIEELVAAIQVMSDAGIQGAMAGTSLRRSLSALAGGTKEAVRIFKSLGVETQTATGAMRPLADIVDDLNRAMADLGEAERVSLLMQAFGQRAGPAMAALLAEGGDALRRYEKSLQGAAGTAKRIAETQLNTLQGRMIKLKSAMEGLVLTIGERLLPKLSKLTSAITGQTAAMAKADQAAITNALSWGELALKIGILLVVIPKVLRGLSGLAVLLGPGGALALGLTTIAAGIALLAANWAEAKMRGEDFGDTVYRNTKLLTGYRDALDEVTEQEKRLNRIRKPAADIKTRQAREGKAYFGSQEHLQDVNRGLNALRTQEQAATKALLESKAAAAGVIGRQMAHPESRKWIEWREQPRRKVAEAEERLRVIRHQIREMETMQRQAVSTLGGRALFGLLPESLQARIGAGTGQSRSLLERLGIAARGTAGVFGAAVRRPGEARREAAEEERQRVEQLNEERELEERMMAYRMELEAAAAAKRGEVIERFTKRIEKLEPAAEYPAAVATGFAQLQQRTQQEIDRQHQEAMQLDKRRNELLKDMRDKLKETEEEFGP